MSESKSTSSSELSSLDDTCGRMFLAGGGGTIEGFLAGGGGTIEGFLAGDIIKDLLGDAVNENRPDGGVI